MRALGFVILFLMVAGSNTRSAEWFGNASRPWRIYKYNSTACNNQTLTSQDWIVKSKVIEKQTFCEIMQSGITFKTFWHTCKKVTQYVCSDTSCSTCDAINYTTLDFPDWDTAMSLYDGESCLDVGATYSDRAGGTIGLGADKPVNTSGSYFEHVSGYMRYKMGCPPKATSLGATVGALHVLFGATLIALL